MMISVCVWGGGGRNRDACFFWCECNGAWDGLEEKERKMGVMKVYVEVNDDVENGTIRYPGEVWSESQRNERNRVNVLP